MKRGLLYAGGLGSAAVIIYILVNRANKKKLEKKIYAIIDGEMGDMEKNKIQLIMDGKKSMNRADAFNPQIFLTSLKYGPGSKTLDTTEMAKQKAKDIYDAWGVFDDNEEKIYGVLKSMKTKLNVAQIAHFYNKQFKSDLFSDLNYKLSDSEKKTAFGIVDELPSK